jgi:UPF0716 family protein affecting phage T7 exclusion
VTAHFTLGHFLYVVAAIDALLGVWMLLKLRDAPDSGGDEARGRAFTAGATFVSAILLCLVGTFTDVATIPLF